MSQNPIKILYVLGRGRSGSTILANVIGEHERFFSAGEVRYLWDPVVTHDAQCACGRSVSACPVWAEVLQRLDDVSVDDAARWQREVVKERNLLKVLRYPRRGRWEALEAYRSVMERMYSTLAEVTGASVIVDSSKRPSYAAVVRLMQGYGLYSLHMLRDPRASAYSWASRRHASVFGGGTEVKRRGAVDSTIRWNILNLEAELFARYLPPERRLRLRYEDFVAAPRDTAEMIKSFVGEEDIPSPFVDQRTVTLTSNHAIAGNPSRFSTGELTIKETGDWLTHQRPRDRFMASAVALPYMRRYGYPFRL